MGHKLLENLREQLLLELFADADRLIRHQESVGEQLTKKTEKLEAAVQRMSSLLVTQRLTGGISAHIQGNRTERLHEQLTQQSAVIQQLGAEIRAIKRPSIAQPLIEVICAAIRAGVLWALIFVALSESLESAFYASLCAIVLHLFPMWYRICFRSFSE